MRRHLSIPGLILTVLLSVSGNAAQRPLPETSQPSPALQDAFVHVVFTVTGKHHEFVNGLPQSQFRLLDNGKPPREIVHFENPSAFPMRIGILLDASNSARDSFPVVRKATEAFVRDNVHDPSEGFVLAFNEIAVLVQGLTSDPDQLAASLDKIKPGGATALWDALYLACREQMLRVPAHGTQRRTIILISDGDDNQSRALRQEAVQMAQRAEVTVYAIVIESERNPSHGMGERNLKMLAEATGGRAIPAAGENGLKKAFKEIQDALNSQYSVLYKPDNLTANGEFRPIQIELSPPNKDLKVQVRKGYFAPKQ